MIEVKREKVKIAGEKRIIKAEFGVLVHSLVDSGGFSKEEIEETVERGCMTDEERKADTEKKLQELTDKIRETSKDATDDEIKKAIDTIVAKFMERM